MCCARSWPDSRQGKVGLYATFVSSLKKDVRIVIAAPWLTPMGQESNS